MDSSQLVLIAIMVLVLIVLPIVLGRMSGRSPMEVFFGRRVNQTAFGRKEDRECGPEDGSPRKASPKATVRETGSRNDLLGFVSEMVTYARRNHFRIIVPGTIQADGKTAGLAVILITRNRVLGMNCFGYPGKIQVGEGDSPWRQSVGGVRHEIDSPVVKNRGQEEILAAALTRYGYPQTECEVVGVFTSPQAELSGTRTRDGLAQNGCYTRTSLKQFLASDHCMKVGGVEPEKVEAALSPHILRAEKPKARH